MEGFTRFARVTEHLAGHPATFVFALGTIIVWAVCGPLFGWSDTWQLVINTGTTIVTFLMVFVIQHGQSRDTKSIQLKLDELIRATNSARNLLVCLEERSDKEIEAIKADMTEAAE